MHSFIRVFAAFQTQIYEDREDVFRYCEQIGQLGPMEYARTVSGLRALSDLALPEAPAYPARLLLLSTCSYHPENGRFVVAAYRTN